MAWAPPASRRACPRPLRALGFKAVYAVLGGLDGWTDEVLYPLLPRGKKREGC